MKTKNYKLLFLFVGAMLFIVNSTIAQKTTYDDSWAKAGFNLTKENSTGVKINYSINEFSLEDIEIKGEAMQKLMLPGHFLPNDEGAPDLPGNGRYIAILQGANAKLIISASRIETLSNINISPAPRIPLDTETGPLVYNKNNEIYSKNAFYPEKPVILSAPSKIRGVDVVMLGITPFQYNPVTKELLVYRDLEIEVVFEGGNNHFGEDILRSRWFDPILEDAILNYASLPEIDYDKRILNYNSSRDVGCEYLIVSPDGVDFQSWADSIKSFRIKQGILSEVVTLSDIGGNNVTTLENYFNDAYNNWDIPPVAVLLLADYGTSGNTIISPTLPHPYQGTYITDNIYADVDGDNLPEIIFARITARDNSELEVMITKFLDYERTPPINPDFYDHPITALGWQTTRWFQICSESIGGFFKNEQSKDPVRINEIYSGNPGYDPWSTATNTSTVVNYFGPNGLGYIPATPQELGGWSGGNATMINNTINSGSFIVQHRDHGSETGWAHPGYHNSDINGLNNTDLTFVMSINCLTGKFNYTSECFTEKFHRHTYNGQNSGALGLIAASEVSFSFVNDTYVWGVYDNMWTDFMPDYGTTPDSRGLLPAFGNSAGKYFLQQSSWPYNTNSKVVTYNLFHHHGDAFLTLYSEVPQDLDILHDGVILGGLDFFTVQATDSAFIALTVDDEIIGTGYGQGIGVPVDISIIPQQPGTVVLMTATLTNYFRYTELIDVIPPDGPYCIQDSYTINDDNGNGIPEFGETILISLAIKNIGNSDAIGANVKISANDSYITISDSTEYYDTIPSQQIITVTDGFEIQVADNIPDQHMTMFDVTITDELDSTWNSVIFMTYSAPMLEIGTLTINDMISGNGNGRLDPGETAEIIVKIYNKGHCLAENTIGYLSTDCHYIELLNDVDTIGTIGFFGPNVARFDVTVDPETPNGVIIATFDYEVVSGAYQETETFIRKIGLLYDDFETGDFSKFDWQHDGDVYWTVSYLYPYEGYYSAKSGAIGDNQYSELSLTLEIMTADSISFVRKV
ncbi:MAG: hypothetical protein IMY69_01825, partial [Bacteroidetes bacterium]|nr:hypothetical protein [Bacteroidota bacterium]